jgi:hypothetical protein
LRAAIREVASPSCSAIPEPDRSVGKAFADSAAMGNLLWLIIIILIIMWLGGFALHIGGGLIHILIVIALILLIVRLVSGRRVL